MKAIVEVIELEKDEIVTILSGFIPYGGYWANLSYNNTEFTEAKAREIIVQGKNNDDEVIVCYEEVLANMLLNGKSLIINDVEEDFSPKELTLEKLIKGMNLSIRNNNMSMEPEDWDAVDCDVIVQNALFDEVVFG